MTSGLGSPQEAAEQMLQQVGVLGATLVFVCLGPVEF